MIFPLEGKKKENESNIIFYWAITEIFNGTIKLADIMDHYEYSGITVII